MPLNLIRSPYFGRDHRTVLFHFRYWNSQTVIFLRYHCNRLFTISLLHVCIILFTTLFSSSMLEQSRHDLLLLQSLQWSRKLIDAGITWHLNVVIIKHCREGKLTMLPWVSVLHLSYWPKCRQQWPNINALLVICNKSPKWWKATSLYISWFANWLRIIYNKILHGATKTLHRNYRYS